MFYLICFISGLFMGAMIPVIIYFIREWVPIIKMYKAGDTAFEKQDKLTDREQWNEMFKYTGYAPPKREIDDE